MMATRDERDNFSMLILARADTKMSTAMETIVTYCEENGLEVEAAATLVNEVLKAKLEEEAMFLRYLPRSAKLPL